MILIMACLIGIYIFAVYKLTSKSAFYSRDLNVTIAGMPECTWVDLYCEGKYQGLYLLTEDVAADYKNISRGVLLEREDVDRLEPDESFFETKEGHYLFVYNSPSDLSDVEMMETDDFVQNVEALILAGDDSYKEYIDLDTDKIYAGPFWDYDFAVGSILPNYNASIVAKPNGMALWYDTFYNDSEFYRIMCETYVGLQAGFERILQEDIDSYVEWIRASAEMDNVLFVPGARKIVYYTGWDSYVRYLKYFLANRLNYLNDLWRMAQWLRREASWTGLA